MNKDASRNFSSVTTQQQVILRLPDDLAERVRKVLSEGQQIDKAGALVIDIQQQDSQPSDKYIFIFQTEKYYALLANLPTNVETHKTFDKKIFIKTGDIGQILVVFKTEKERDTAFSRTCKTVNGDYYPSGLTPPTVDIVRRKFELTRKAEQYPTHSVRAILDELKRPWTPITEAQSLKTLAPTDEENPDDEHGRDRDVCEVVYEEVVAFEDWMVSRECPEGVHAVITGREWGAGGSGVGSSQLLQDHPEILITEVDLEEDRDREDYISVMKAQKAKDEAGNAATLDAAAAAAALNITIPIPSALPSAAEALEKETEAEAAEEIIAQEVSPKTVTSSSTGGAAHSSGPTLLIKRDGQDGHLTIKKEPIAAPDAATHGLYERARAPAGSEGGVAQQLAEGDTGDSSLLKLSFKREVVKLSVSREVPALDSAKVTRTAAEAMDVDADVDTDVDVDAVDAMTETETETGSTEVYSSSGTLDPAFPTSISISCAPAESESAAVRELPAVSMTDDAEATRKAFEEASDSDEDEEEVDEEGEGEAEGEGAEDDDDDGEEEILEEGACGEDAEVARSNEVDSAMNEGDQPGEEAEAVGKGEESGGDDNEEEEDEEDWMKDV